MTEGARTRHRADRSPRKATDAAVAHRRAVRATPVSRAREHNLRRWQLRLVASVLLYEVQMVAIRGGLGSGKTAGLVFLAEAIAESRPGATILLVTDGWPRLRDVLRPLCDEIFIGATYRASDREYRWPNGSVVRLRMYYTRGADAGQNALEGGNVTAVLIDEAQTLPMSVLDRAGDRARVWLPDVSGALTAPIVVLCGVPCEPCWWLTRVREIGAEPDETGFQVPIAVFLPESGENAEAYGPSWLAAARKRLGPEQFEALYENKPRPPKGNIYDCFEAHTGLPPTNGRPAKRGNLLKGWRWDPSMKTVLVVDFGLNKPAVIAAALDEDLGAWVLFDAFSPTSEGRDDTTTDDLVRYMRARWWPRRWSHLAPETVTVFVDEVIADPAGRARNVQTGKSDLQVLGYPVPGALADHRQFGFGLRPIIEEDPDRKDEKSGILKVRMAFQGFRLLVSEELWQAGLEAPAAHHTLSRSILGYRYNKYGEPRRHEGFDDFCDCIRYLVRRHLWTDIGIEDRMPLAVRLPTPRTNRPR